MGAPPQAPEPPGRRWRAALALLVGGLALGTAGGQVPATIPVMPETPDAALDALLEGARPAARAAACDAQEDTLARVLCRGVLVVGTRSDYPPFGVGSGPQAQGFEPDLARQLAARLGVTPHFVAVSAADRMAALGEGRVDLVIATTGHTVQRDSQALFVRPHYYRSQTVVVGQRFSTLQAVDSLPALAGHTICVTVGNATNAELALHGAHLMLYASARQLVEQVQAGTCALAAQDDSLLLPVLPMLSVPYDLKLGFAALPWGAAVSRDGGAALERALGLALQGLHARGTLVALARRHGVPAPWLETEQQRWSQPPCDSAAARDEPRCVDPPYDNRMQPTPFAGGVDRFERWLEDTTGWRVTLAMLKTEVALQLFLAGLGMSLALVAGAVVATVALGLAFGAGLHQPQRALRWPLRAVLLAAQSTPMVLLMSAAGLLLSSAGWTTPATAWLAAVAVLGLFNGSNAGQAIAEAHASLLAEGRPATLKAAALRARAQVAAFCVNATRGSPAASLIGVPELLAAQTDIASFSNERVTTFALLLVFYMALVSIVVALLARLQRRLEASAG